jgi:hypothetical protein
MARMGDVARETVRARYDPRAVLFTTTNGADSSARARLTVHSGAGFDTGVHVAIDWHGRML